MYKKLSKGIQDDKLNTISLIGLANVLVDQRDPYCKALLKDIYNQALKHADLSTENRETIEKELKTHATTFC